MTAQLLEEMQERPGMTESPRLFDQLSLAALPTAVSCARLFTKYTLDNWRAPFVVADAVIVAGELVRCAVADTGVVDPAIRWSELDDLNLITVCLLGYRERIVIQVWDTAQQPAMLPEVETYDRLQGLHLVDVTAYRWGSTIDPRGRVVAAELLIYPRTESGLPMRHRRTVWSHHSAHQHTPMDDELLRRVRDGLDGL